MEPLCSHVLDPPGRKLNCRNLMTVMDACASDLLLPTSRRTVANATSSPLSALRRLGVLGPPLSTTTTEESGEPGGGGASSSTIMHEEEHWELSGAASAEFPAEMRRGQDSEPGGS